MPGLFKNKYRNDSIRLKNFDYSSNGYYFITICTHNKMNFFGNITNGQINLSKIGQIASECWKKIPEKFPNAALDEFIIMPDHFHGILLLNGIHPRRDAINRVPTFTTMATTMDNNQHGGITGNYNPMLTDHSLGKIIRWYKGRTTFEIHKLNNHLNFEWQPRFYEQIIRDENSLQRIREYIVNNPSKTYQSPPPPPSPHLSPTPPMTDLYAYHQQRKHS